MIDLACMGYCPIVYKFKFTFHFYSLLLLFSYSLLNELMGLALNELKSISLFRYLN